MKSIQEGYLWHANRRPFVPVHIHVQGMVNVASVLLITEKMVKYQGVFSQNRVKKVMIDPLQTFTMI
jgi:hypothetical protein